MRFLIILEQVNFSGPNDNITKLLYLFNNLKNFNCYLNEPHSTHFSKSCPNPAGGFLTLAFSGVTLPKNLLSWPWRQCVGCKAFDSQRKHFLSDISELRRRPDVLARLTEEIFGAPARSSKTKLDQTAVGILNSHIKKILLVQWGSRI